MTVSDDWRLTPNAHEYLMNEKLKYVPKFKKHSDDWDHEHCEFCFEKFSEDEGLKNGYCTLDKKFWICPVCFNDFAEMFNWEIV